MFNISLCLYFEKFLISLWFRDSNKFIILDALQIDMKRADMIRRRDPGPYEDIKGPTVLALMLMVSITIQFAIKLYSIM